MSLSSPARGAQLFYRSVFEDLPLQWEGGTKYPPYAFGGSHVCALDDCAARHSAWHAERTEHPKPLQQYTRKSRKRSPS